MNAELVTARHLNRKAVIYIRQSSPHQVLTNQESLRLFPLCREHVTATEYRAARTRAFELWAEITGVAAAA